MADELFLDDPLVPSPPRRAAGLLRAARARLRRPKPASGAWPVIAAAALAAVSALLLAGAVILGPPHMGP